MVITIDGLSENGKTTSAKMLADKLGINYFNSGSIFRYISYLISLPSGLISISQVIVNLSSLGFKEQIPLDI